VENHFVKINFLERKKLRKNQFSGKTPFWRKPSLQPNVATLFQKSFKHIVETTTIASDVHILMVGKTCGEV